MAYGTPANPVAGTVITVAYATSNILDPIRWLRLLTGNADPPGTSYVVVSDSTTGTTWRKIPTDAIADGAVTTPKIADANVTAAKLAADVALANLGFTPVNKAGDAMTGGLVMPGATITGGLTMGGTITGAAIDAVTIAASKSGPTPSSTAYAAAHLRAVTSDNSAPTIGFERTGTSAIALYESGHRLFGWGADNVHGEVALATGAKITNLHADAVDGAHASATPTAGTIPIADGSGKLDAWISPTGASVPSGVIVGWQDNATIPSGWARFTQADGRYLVGAGTASGVTNAQTFTQNANAGSSDFAHLHAGNSLAVAVTGSATGGPSDVTGNNSAAGQSAGTGTNRADSPHNHSLNGVSLAVSASGSATGNTTGATWVPPAYALVWIKKS